MFSILWQVLYIGWLAAEIYIAIATRTKRGGGSVRDRGTMLLLWVVIFSSIGVGMSWSVAHGPNLTWGVPWIRDASLALLFLGLLLRFSAVISLGKAFSVNVAIRDGQRVKKTGLYRWMRHPSYTGSLLCLFAAGAHTQNWIAFLIIFVPPVAAFLYRIHVEEIALREHFGEEYVVYSRETKRLVPGIY
jgi:protein-S-isoprenylcysteine O-methyltransferase Ste14